MIEGVLHNLCQIEIDRGVKFFFLSLFTLHIINFVLEFGFQCKNE